MVIGQCLGYLLMKNLIKLTSINNEMCISSDLMSGQIGTDPRSMKRLITKHKNRLESFGEVRFQITPKTKKTVYFLNEDQAIFLLTLSKNTEIVVDFKHKLVKEFSRLKRQEAIAAEKKAKVEYQQNRSIGKLIHRKETDIVQDFIPYATAQGSKGYQKNGYIVISKMINQVMGIKSRDTANEDEIQLLAVADMVVEKSLIDGMRKQQPYKNIFQQAKANLKIMANLALKDQE